MSRALVLGCGPAGLIATHAAVMGGFDEVALWSKARKSRMMGAQYLHAPIPGISHPGDQFNISYQLRGDVAGYKDKVYGVDFDGTVSPEDLAADHPAWDIRSAYDKLWDVYSEFVTPWRADNAGLADLVGVMDRGIYDLVVTSIPAPVMCQDPRHAFTNTTVWSNDQAMHGDENDTVVCNGEESPAWYRSARIQGWGTTEWPWNRCPPVNPLWEVVKPVATTCDCWPNVLRVGRYGTWRKGVLSHEAWQEVFDLAQAAS